MSADALVLGTKEKQLRYVWNDAQSIYDIDLGHLILEPVRSNKVFLKNQISKRIEAREI